jgi:Arc/MetJ-type ribon-helix-helix transcriptional regulator
MKKHGEINWSEVVRRSIEEYLERLEGSIVEEPSENIIEELLKRGITLEELKPEEEERLYKELRDRTWERTRSTIQAQS